MRKGEKKKGRGGDGEEAVKKKKGEGRDSGENRQESKQAEKTLNYTEVRGRH